MQVVAKTKFLLTAMVTLLVLDGQLLGSSDSMVKLLAQLARKSNPIRNTYVSADRARMLKQQLARTIKPVDRLELLNQYAVELLNAGQTEEALKQFGVWESLAKETAPVLYKSNHQLLKHYQALCYLRLGEQENCIEDHTTESCLLPIQGEGVHRFPRGSEGAITIFEEILRKHPDDVSSRWLLNIAYMTLGKFPKDVPAPWKIAPETFDSPFDIRRFPDVAGGLGLDVNALSGGSVVEDFDGDGWLDVLVSAWGLSDPMHYFKNLGNGQFEDQTKKAGLDGLTGGLNMMPADFDNDGDVDVLVLRGAWLGSEGSLPNSLLRNDGNGQFEDVTEESGILSFHPTQTAVWLDYNNDGWLDLFVGNESHGRERHASELFRNNGNGTFTETARACGINVRSFVKGTAAADFDNDGYMDLFISRQNEPNLLYRNAGPSKTADGVWKFQDVTTRAGVSEPVHSFPCWFFDYDNDGFQDLFVAGYRIENVGDIAADYLGLPHGGTKAKLFRNKGDGTFEDRTEALGLDKVLHAMGSNYGDLDNDGYLDFYIGTGDPDLSTLVPNRMFRNNAGKAFQEVTTSGGFGHLQKGHGISFADLDHDGDQDVYANMGGAVTGDFYRNALFENPGHANHWLKLTLSGIKSNRNGIGSRIQLVVREPEGQTRTIHRVLRSGGSFGASPLRLEIGLGKASSIDTLTIHWHGSGVNQVFEKLPANRWITIEEASAQPSIRELTPIQFQKTSHHHH